MTTATADLDLLSTGEIAEMYGVDPQVVRKVLDRIGLGKRIGRYRVVAAEDVGQVELALRAAGYPKAEPVGVAV